MGKNKPENKSLTKNEDVKINHESSHKSNLLTNFLVLIIAVLLGVIIYQQNFNLPQKETASTEPNVNLDKLYQELKDKIKQEILDENLKSREVITEKIESIKNENAPESVINQIKEETINLEKIEKVQDTIKSEITEQNEKLSQKEEQKIVKIEDKKIEDLTDSELKFQNGQPVVLDSSKIKFQTEEIKNEEDTGKKENLEKKVELKKIPKEVENFPTKKISKMKTKKMWIPIPNSNGGHRRVPPIEIKFGKEHHSSVKVWLFEEFLSKEESEQLIQAHESHLKETLKQRPIICFDSVSTLKKNLIELQKDKIAELVTPNDFTSGTTCLNQTFSRQLEKWGLKWSYSTAFYPGESKFSKIFGKRIEEATMLNETHGGKFQVTSYPNGVGYKDHTDCVVDSNDQRDRYGTFLVYLNELGADGGGETIFPELGIDVKPRQGRALTWNNMNYETGKCEPKSIHRAAEVKHPVKKKYIIQRWYYYKNFYALGKRMPEASLPERPPNTPKVSCDNYDNGSCRMYDEWNPDHMIDYQRDKKIY